MLSHHTRNSHSKNGTAVLEDFFYTKWYGERSKQTSVYFYHTWHIPGVRHRIGDAISALLTVNTDEQLSTVRTESKCACCVDGPVP